jgi:hypothetical protein
VSFRRIRTLAVAPTSGADDSSLPAPWPVRSARARHSLQAVAGIRYGDRHDRIRVDRSAAAIVSSVDTGGRWHGTVTRGVRWSSVMSIVSSRCDVAATPVGLGCSWPDVSGSW